MYVHNQIYYLHNIYIYIHIYIYVHIHDIDFDDENNDTDNKYLICYSSIFILSYFLICIMIIHDPQRMKMNSRLPWINISWGEHVLAGFTNRTPCIGWLPFRLPTPEKDFYSEKNQLITTIRNHSHSFSTRRSTWGNF